MPPSAARTPARLAGWTLIELLAVLAILGLLAGLGTPLLQGLRAEAALRAAVRQTQAGLHLARQLALASGRPVTVCATRDGRRCQPGGSQWMLFASPGPGALTWRAAGEPVVRSWWLAPALVVRSSRDHAAYLPTTSAATTVTFDFCHPAVPALRRSLVVSQTGRVRVTSPGPASSPARATCP